MAEKLYACRNPTCALGTLGEPGYFTDGITPEQAVALSGDPDSPHGPGVCPNCGAHGEPEGEHESVRGEE